MVNNLYVSGNLEIILWASGFPHRGLTYSTGCSQHNTDFAKTDQNEVVRICTNFFEDFRIRKLIRENEFVILNL